MTIAFIGGGNMAGAIVAGLCANGTDPNTVCVSDPNREKLDALRQTYGIRTFDVTSDWLLEADIVVLAVKPQVLKEVCKFIADFIRPSATVLSIAAGVTSESIGRWLNHERIVRCMPNTPAMVGKGMSGLYAPDAIDARTREAIQDVMQCVGRVRWVEKEDDLHVITGGSGSGPAYVFHFLQGLQEALQAQGMDLETARDVALTTLEGAAALARASAEPFEDLRAKVTSKGGTTAKAIEVFEARDCRAIVDQAVRACIARSREMAEVFK